MRRNLKRLAIFLAVAAAAYGCVWFAGSWYLGTLFDGWVEQQRSKGWTISFETREREGFPLDWLIRVTAPKIAGPVNDKTSVAWTAPVLFVHWSPWRPRELVLRGHKATGIATRAPDLPNLEFTAHKIISVIPLGRTWPRQHRLIVDGLASKGLPKGNFEVTRLEAQLRLNQPPPEPQPERKSPAETASADIHLFGLTLPPSIDLPLGRTISGAHLKASLLGKAPRNVKDAGELARWRDQGGTIEIERFDLTWSHLGMTTKGTLALDSELRPLAAVTAKIAGHQQLLDALVAAGTVKSSQALVARFAFTALAQRGGTDDGKIIVPLEAQDGWLRLGPLRLVRLQPIVK